ncbi:putative G-protein coupled receptor F59B2.13 [Haliotis rufescens]|uniref:putative G-protein coupled receptor F59B2.13 n=1 Tax=Haliotis rufescens TaxID=6454 RepID=UPI00201F4343|nr:putative G-protein coupled receptor F59B2.13 [Haliotis rufescens]
MSGELACVILLLCSIYRKELAVNGNILNVTANGHVDSTTLVPTDTASSDGACNSTFNCSSDHVDVTTVKDDPPVQWLISPEKAYAVIAYIKPMNIVLYMLALILNSLNISVFMSQDHSSTNCYLIAISAGDILYAACLSVGDTYITITANYQSLFHNTWVNYVGLYVEPVLQRIINCLVFLVSIERLIVVVYPLKAKEFVLMRRPKSIIMMAVLTTALFHIFSPLRYTVTATTDPTTNATVFSMVPSQLFLQNQAILRGMSTASKVLFVYTFLIGGLILNVLVVCALKHHSKKRRQMATTTDTDKAAKRERQTTITIVTSSFVFLFLALPISTNSIVFNLFPDVYGPNTPNYYVFLMVQNLSSILSSLSLSTDFVAYFFLSTSFRTTFYRIVHIKQAGSPSKCTDQMTDHTNTA